MGLHFGRTKHKGTMTFVHEGMWYKGADDDDYEFRRYSAPRPQVRPIRRMWGVSAWGVFVGIITVGKVAID